MGDGLSGFAPVPRPPSLSLIFFFVEVLCTPISGRPGSKAGNPGQQPTRLLSHTMMVGWGDLAFGRAWIRTASSSKPAGRGKAKPLSSLASTTA
ncbi:hypothetical protein LX36DRAFT_327803 [Colletotrichum falcatum]|nr:hypothetical protein LX36DRAFT_327803 [Colletotrichum falcatum]